jgi:hypothetical protein
MKPLLLHGSCKSTSDRRRRILHFVFGPKELPGGLNWPPRARESEDQHRRLGRERDAQGPRPTRDASAARTVASASNGRM